MTTWQDFDRESDEERAEREQSITRIAANEQAALSLLDNILDEMTANPASGRAAVDALGNLVYRVQLAHRKASDLYAARTYKPRRALPLRSVS